MATKKQDDKPKPSSNLAEDRLLALEKALLESNQNTDKKLARIDERLEKTTDMVNQSIQREQSLAELSNTLSRANVITQSLQQGVPPPPGDYTTPLTPTGQPLPERIPVEEEEEEEGDRFQTVVALLIAILALLGGVVAWRGTLIKFEDDDIAGLEASLNAETTRSINNAELYERYGAYTTYTINEQFRQILEQDLAEGDASAQSNLENQRNEVSDVAATSRLFFPSRYLNRDGNYDIERDLGEAWAQAGQSLDLNPAPHFVEADRRRDVAVFFAVAFVGMSIALLFYALAEALNPDRKILRYSMAIVGTIFLVLSSTMAILFDISLQ